MYQITSASNINSKRLHKKKCENDVYKNYNNGQINTYVNTIRSKIWDNSMEIKV